MHVRRKGCVYQWRRKVPLALAQRWKRKELVRSLHTSIRADALKAAREMSSAADRLFTELERRPTLTTNQIEELARQWFADALKVDEEQRLRATPHKAAYITSPLHGEDPVSADVGLLHDLLDDAWEANARNDVGKAAADVASVLDKSGLTLDETERLLLSKLLLRGHVQLLKLAIARRQGDYSAKPDDEVFVPPPPTAPVPEVINPAEQSMKLGALVTAFAESQERDSKWTPDTKRKSLPKLKLFVETVGDRPVDTIAPDHIRDWRDALEDMDLSPNTIGLHFKLAAAMFNWAKRERKSTIDNPTKGLAPRPEKGTRDAYTPEDLSKLFWSPMYTGHWREDRRDRPGKLLVKDHKFWFPLVALHTGMRVEEIAQLKRADLREIDGVWCFDITKAKTAAGVRKVPVHPRLLDLGLLDYHAGLKGDRMWPLLEAGTEGKYSQAFVQWWPQFRRLIGMDREGLKFHSFRHTFISFLLEKQGVAEHVVARLAGQEVRSITAGVYGGKLATPADRLEVFKDADFGVDLSHLLPSKAGG